VVTAVVVVAVGIALAWGQWFSPTAQARRAVLALGSPIPDAPDTTVVVTHPSCDDASSCVSAARSWAITVPLTFARADALTRSWESRRKPTRVDGWTCGPQDGPFGSVISGGGCTLSLELDVHGSMTPVFVWVTFRNPGPLATAYAAAVRTRAVNAVVDPLRTLGSQQVTSVNVQVVTPA